jgi:hypothetical protein
VSNTRDWHVRFKEKNDAAIRANMEIAQKAWSKSIEDGTNPICKAYEEWKQKQRLRRYPPRGYTVRHNGRLL